MPVSLEAILQAVEERRTALTAETAGYLALELAHRLSRSPGTLYERNVVVDEDGSVQVLGLQRSSDEVDAEQCVRNTLLRMLEMASGETPSLVACANADSGQGIAALIGELESALVPLNHAAARRSLARMARETVRTTPVEVLNSSVTEHAERRSAPPFPSREKGRDVLLDRQSAESGDPQALSNELFSQPISVLEAATEPEYSEDDADTDMDTRVAPTLEPTPTVEDVVMASDPPPRVDDDNGVDGSSPGAEVLADPSGSGPNVLEEEHPIVQREDMGYIQPRAPRLAFSMVLALLVLGLGAAVSVYLVYPQFFLGH